MHLPSIPSLSCAESTLLTGTPCLSSVVDVRRPTSVTLNPTTSPLAVPMAMQLLSWFQQQQVKEVGSEKWVVRQLVVQTLLHHHWHWPPEHGQCPHMQRRMNCNWTRQCPWCSGDLGFCTQKQVLQPCSSTAQGCPSSQRWQVCHR